MKPSIEHLAGDVDRARDLLLGTVAHDLRVPLQAILMGIGVVERGGPSDDLISTLRSVVNGMDRLIAQLLSFAHTRSANIQLARRPVVLAKLCREVVGQLQLAYPRAAISLGPPCDEACGEWDPDRLWQVVCNLLSNALTHGDRRRPVSLKIRDLGNAVELNVANSGRPIPAEMRAHLFEPFRRGSGKGAGLGLYIVDQIVRAHGGTIDVTSDTTTVFKVTLAKGG